MSAPRTIPLTRRQRAAADAESYVDPGPERQPGEDFEEDALAAESRPRSGAALVDLILSRSSEPWVALKVGGQTIAELPLGGHAVLDGPTGSGKTTLASAVAVEHARTVGPAIYASLELGAAEVAGRIIGAHVAEAWKPVLQGRVAREHMLTALPERLEILSGAEAQAAALPVAIARVRARWPGEPVLLVFDYIQLAAMTGDDMRVAVAHTAEFLRAFGEKERIAILVLSQPSRAASRDLRNGEVLGSGTIGVSSESAQVERGATVTIAIGGGLLIDEHGWAVVDLSTGKGRYGGGDRVWAARYHGAHGRWLIQGEPRRGADVQAERRAGQDSAKVDAARLAMTAAAGKASAPMILEELRQRAACSRDVARAAVTAAVASGDLVACPPRPRSSHPTYWTAARRDAVSEDSDGE